MSPSALILPMAVHVGWTAFLYAVLTFVRAPTAWGVGALADGSNPWSSLEQRVSGNLSNQFEWPLLFYVVCLLLVGLGAVDSSQIWLAWIFVAGRIVHSGVQIAVAGVRLRGIVFTINFVAVLVMWARLLLVELGSGR